PSLWRVQTSVRALSPSGAPVSSSDATSLLSTQLLNRPAVYSKGEMKMFYINDQKNHLRNLIRLVLATAILTSMFAVTSYSANGSSSSVVKTNRAARPLTQSPALKANGKIAFVSSRDGNREIYLM